MKLALIDINHSYFEIRIYLCLKKGGLILSQLKSSVRVAPDFGLFSWIAEYLNTDLERVIVFSSDGSSAFENMDAIAKRINILRKITTLISSISIETRLPVRDLPSFLLTAFLLKQN